MEHDPQNAELLPELDGWEQESDEALLNSEGKLLTTSVATRSTSFTLTPRDLDIIYSVGIYKYLSVFQLQTLHFPNARYYRTATHRLAALVSANLLSRAFYHPRVTAHTGRPASILYLQPENLETLAALLASMGKASLIARFDDITPTDRDSFAYNFIMHELGISEFYIAFPLSDRPGSLVFWERTSPKIQGVTQKLEATVHNEAGSRKHTLSFNPDGFLCYRTPDGYLTFKFYEHDNNTETNLNAIYRKYAAYLALDRRHLFPDLLRRFLNKHGVTLTDDEIADAEFDVLTTAPNAERRDKLIREVNKLDESDRFYFADLSDITPATIHTPLWRKASDYDTIAREEKRLPKETKPSIRARFIRERMPSLPTYALSD